jgi:glycosyltransferase involved in cell wall biosynthesis
MVEKEKVLILITRGVLGGAQAFVFNVAHGLQKTGVDVAVAFGDGECLREKCRRWSINTHTLTTLRRTFNPIQNIRAIFEIRGLLQTEKYDVLHINSSNALFAAISARMSAHKPRVVFTFHGLSLMETTAQVSAFIKIAYWVVLKTLLLFVDEVVFVSGANKARAEKLRMASNSTVIYNAIDSNSLAFLDQPSARADLEKKAGVPLSGAFLAGSVGRLSGEKNYEFLVRNWEHIKSKIGKAQLVLIGDGPQREMLERIVREKGLEHDVVFVGELVDAHRFLRAFDVFVLTSRYEGMSVSILEALAAGVPILASDVGGIREQVPYIEHQVFTRNDAKEFTKKIIAIASKDAIRTKLANANKKQSTEHFSYTRMIEQYRDVYGLMLHQR